MDKTLHETPAGMGITDIVLVVLNVLSIGVILLVIGNEIERLLDPARELNEHCCFALMRGMLTLTWFLIVLFIYNTEVFWVALAMWLIIIGLFCCLVGGLFAVKTYQNLDQCSQSIIRITLVIICSITVVIAVEHHRHIAVETAPTC
jgi:hypothetical protein